MPPISPCSRVVDMVRSCFEGKWRFFANRPDLLTAGYHFFVSADTPAINGLHPFGSGVWTKDGGRYPDFPVGQVMSEGQTWYPGEAPAPLPPDNQVGATAQFSERVLYPPSPVPRLRHGFDERCYVVRHPGVDIDLIPSLRPDIFDCCWQRVLARLLELLHDATPASVTKFTDIASAIWGPEFTVKVRAMPFDGPLRYGLILHPKFQIVLLPGTKTFDALWQELRNGISRPAHRDGLFYSDKDWCTQSRLLTTRLQQEGWLPDVPQTLVGHSRGAVHAAMIAVRAKMVDNLRDIHLLTFASPKPGDKQIVWHVNRLKANHVVNEEDIVPNLPPEIELSTNVGIFVIRELGGLPPSWQRYPLYQIMRQQGPDFRPLPNLTDRTWLDIIRAWVRNEEPAAIAQHFLSAYVARLASCCNRPVFPFSPNAWTMLFGEEDNNIGGVLLGGEAFTTHSEIGGVVVGGSGQIMYPTVVVGAGGILANGSLGIPPAPHVGTGGILAGGSGGSGGPPEEGTGFAVGGSSGSEGPPPEGTGFEVGGEST